MTPTGGEPSNNYVISSIQRALKEDDESLKYLEYESKAEHVSPGFQSFAHESIDVIDHFLEVLSDYKANVVPTSVESLPSKLKKSIVDSQIKSLVVPRGIEDLWTRDLDELELIIDDGLVSKEVLSGIDAVLTGCSFAIASTGTLILTGKKNEGRRILTLLPDFHFCVVNSEDVLFDVEDVFRFLDPVAPITFISGPSATSDIELSRVEGVHGPRNLTVFVVDSRF